MGGGMAGGGMGAMGGAKKRKEKKKKVQHRHVEHDGSKGGESAFGAGPGGSGSMSHPWQKTEPVGVKTDGLAKSEAYGLWQYDMTSRRCRQIARVEIQTHAL